MSEPPAVSCSFRSPGAGIFIKGRTSRSVPTRTRVNGRVTTSAFPSCSDISVSSDQRRPARGLQPHRCSDISVSCWDLLPERSGFLIVSAADHGVLRVGSGGARTLPNAATERHLNSGLRRMPGLSYTLFGQRTRAPPPCGARVEADLSGQASPGSGIRNTGNGDRAVFLSRQGAYRKVSWKARRLVSSHGMANTAKTTSWNAPR